ncbi:MAG: hypothetical protein H0S84_09635 [Bacteroidales bacterium]|jgi:hypothetical protein|nr:hypothetical protein [Bacteroidales bacterium]MDN5350641.1 hypothetical protein [Bacteroidales bacterium]
MTADQLGFLILLVIFATGFAFRRWYIRQPKSYKISDQHINGWQLLIFDHNPRTEGSTIELYCKSNTGLSARDFEFGLELIQKKRELRKLFFDPLSDLKFEQKILPDQSGARFFIEKRSLLQLIRNEEIRLYRFRFFVKIDDQQLIKSPEFAFSSKFLIFKPDTGKFN